MKNPNWRIFFFIREFSYCGKPESKNFFLFFFFYPRILVFWKTGIGDFFFFLIREFSFCGKRERENSRFVKNQNWRIFFFIREFFYCGKPEPENFFFFIREFSFLWKTRIGEIFSFFFFFIREFSFCGKRELENPCFLKNQIWRIFFFFFSENSGFVETEHSRFVENGNWRILVLWKTGIGKIFFIIFFFIREFSFCGNGEFSFGGKQELENSHFVENQNG